MNKEKMFIQACKLRHSLRFQTNLLLLLGKEASQKRAKSRLPISQVIEETWLLLPENKESTDPSLQLIIWHSFSSNNLKG